MKRKLSCTAIIDAETQQCQSNCEAYGVGWKMSQHPQLAGDCKCPPINASSPTKGSCITPLVRQNTWDSESSLRQEMPTPLASSSITSNHLPACSIDAETEVVAVIASNFARKARNSDPSLSSELNHPPLSGFLTSSPSNDSYPTSGDCVSFQSSSISLALQLKASSRLLLHQLILWAFLSYSHMLFFKDIYNVIFSIRISSMATIRLEESIWNLYYVGL